MLAILSTIIGIVFVILLFSILTSALREVIAGYLSLRGKHLVYAIRSMVGNETGNSFLRHPFFQQLTIGSRERVGSGKERHTLPAYINSGTFSAILMDLLEVDTVEDIQARIDNLEEGPLKNVLIFLYRQAGDDLIQFKLKVEEWFNEVMDRASGAFKRNTQRWLFLIGLVTALIFNVDVINVYHNLSINATLRETLADEAGVFVNTQEAPTVGNVEDPNIEHAQEEIGRLVNENISALESPLGLGWDSVDWTKANGRWWLYKVIGWLTTALSISLGATFWFDMLKKLVSLRSSGPAPVSPAPSGLSTTPMIPTGSTLTRKEPDSMLESFSRSAAPARRAPARTVEKKDGGETGNG